MKNVPDVRYHSFLGSTVLRMTAGCAKSLHLCLTLCESMGCGLPGSLSMQFSAQETGVGCHALPQGIFPTPGLNPGLLKGRQILYHLRIIPKLLKARKWTN